ncbi:MAG: DnaJ domain-containing protein [Desulfobacteraceae bacterium]|nr:DnaJ domain-containing protein [Desulfobacteraceae bacterium]
MVWFWIIIVLLYVISQFDLIPDFLGVAGYLDDIIAVFLVYRYAKRVFQPQYQYKPDSNTQYRREKQPHAGPKSGSAAKTPYEVLDVAETASRQEIRSAYIKLANQYHPDKVSHLGEEFQSLADQRFKQIKAAYEELIKE